MDVYSRECLALEVDTSIGGRRVARVLDRLKEQRGLPEVLGSDNGPEFRSRHMDQWAYVNEVKLHFIKPGTPTQNAHIESLNSQIRKRLLNIHWFASLAEVRYRAEEWRTTYNTIQRHGSLSKRTPEEFAAHARLRATTPCAEHEQQPEKMLVGLTRGSYSRGGSATGPTRHLALMSMSRCSSDATLAAPDDRWRVGCQ